MKTWRVVTNGKQYRVQYSENGKHWEFLFDRYYYVKVPSPPGGFRSVFETRFIWRAFRRIHKEVRREIERQKQTQEDWVEVWNDSFKRA